MGLFLKQDEQRSQLQERLAAELRERAAKTSQGEGEAFDAERDSTYLKNTKTTTSLAWVWVLIALAIIGLIVWLVVSTV